MAIACPVADALQPVDHSKLVELGKTLFFDARFSGDGTVSCATCHDPGHAFTDARPVALGIYGRGGTRNTPTLLDLQAYKSFFWDGRTESLTTQVAAPLISPTEMDLPSTHAVEALLRRPPTYLSRFREVFGDSSGQTSYAQFVEAIVAYEGSLLSGTSRFDRFYLSGDSAALNDSEKRGFELFIHRAHCAECHQIDEHHIWFTDGAYRPSGGSPLKTQSHVADIARRLIDMPDEARQRLVSSDADVAALGRFIVTLDPADIGSFRTPSLRNVALTAPYLHDGSIATLSEAIEWELYVRGGQLGQPIDLSPAERSDVLSFLKSLTSATEIGQPE